MATKMRSMLISIIMLKNFSPLMICMNQNPHAQIRSYNFSLTSGNNRDNEQNRSQLPVGKIGVHETPFPLNEKNS